MQGLRTTLLHHIGAPEIGDHYDWLFAVDEPPNEPLLALRCFRRPDEVESDERLAIEPLNAHRVIYLEYEGAISGGRGHVRRMARGRYENLSSNAVTSDLPSSEFRLVWESGITQRWRVMNEATLQCLERKAIDPPPCDSSSDVVQPQR